MINDRIKLVRERFCGGSNAQFAKILGESDQTVNNWVRSGYNVGRGVASKIKEVFPIIDMNWLLTGEGEMLATVNQSYNTGGVNINGNGNNTVTVNKSEFDLLNEIIRTQDAQIKLKDMQLSKLIEQNDRLIEKLIGK